MNVVSRFHYLLLVAPALSLLAGLLVWLNKTGADAGAYRQASKIARFFDDDVDAFLHIPDVNRATRELQSSHFSRLKFDRTFGSAIVRFAPALAHSAVAQALVYGEDWSALDIQDLAFSAKDSNHLTLFHTDSESAQVRALIQKTWASETRASTKTFSELRSDTRFHYIQRGGASIVFADKAQWHFIASERTLIERAIARLQTNTSIQALSLTKNFEQALTPLQSSYEALAYVRSADSSEEGEPENPTFTDKLNRLQIRSLAIAYTNESGLLQEDLSLVTQGPPSEEVVDPEVATTFHEDTLSLTSPNTLIYASSTKRGDYIEAVLFRQFQKRWMAENLASLHQITTSWEDNFTGAWAILLEPLKNPSLGTPSDNGSMAVVLAFSLHNEETTQQALETLSITPGSGIHASPSQTYTLDRALLPSALVNLLEDIHLRVSADRLLVSDQAAGIIQVDQQLLDGSNLSDRSDFQRLADSLPHPSTGLVYVDSENVLRRGVEALRHPLVAATLWLGQRGQSKPALDLQPWRRSAVSTTDILPTLAVWTQTAYGYHQVSLGTVSPAQWMLGAGALMSTIDETFLDATAIFEGKDAFEAPPIEDELLEMIER